MMGSQVSTAGRPAAEALAVALGELIKGLSFKKSMRWNGGLAYSRPLRWVLAMHGPAVVPLVVGDLTGGATTRLLRNAAETEATLGDAGEYGGVMGSAGVEVGFEARKVAIWSAVIAAAKEVGGIIPESNSEELLLEVANLVEAPTVVRGTFDPSFLKLPRELLVMVMRKHQRYFPVTDPDTGDLMPFFVTVANGPIDPAAVAAGNEAVLRARFEDAVFFYESDLEKTLDEFTPALAGTMFQADLGTLLDKTTRVQALVKPLAELMSSTAVDVPGVVPVALRAASLAKADLATSTVMEMTALAGIMGRHYATLGGETEEVATAIWEAILPRNSGDELPASPAGILVSVADRLDSLVGLVAAGCAPSASTDPYALRRTAYAMLQTLVGNGIGVDLRAAASAAAELQPITVSEETLDTALDFVERRLEQLLLDRGLAAQAVRAALAERGSDPALAAETATDLSRFMADNSPALAAVMTSLARPIRIIRGKEVDPDWVVNPELFEQEEERGLWEAYGVAASKKSADMNIAEFLAVAEPLSAPVDAFFDKVFVMADDENVRANRLALLQQVAALQDGVVDFSQLPGF
jgi:glycyl-tRNA synthetase